MGREEFRVIVRSAFSDIWSRYRQDQWGVLKKSRADSVTNPLKLRLLKKLTLTLYLFSEFLATHPKACPGHQKASLASH